MLEVDVNTETMQEFPVVTVQVHTYYISMYNQYQVRSYIQYTSMADIYEAGVAGVVASSCLSG